MAKSFKQTTIELGTLVGILVIGFLIIDVGQSLLGLITDRNTTVVYQPPDVESPITTTTVSGLSGCKDCGGPKYKELEIISPATSKDYGTLTREIWTNSDSFLAEMESIALIGKFLEAELIVEGETRDNLKHLVSVNVDYRSGKYNVGKNGCEEGCLFSKENPINLNIDLMGLTLLSGYKYRLWNDIQPQPGVGKASIAKILVLPMDLKGNPSSVVTSLKIRYLCEQEGGCEIKKCGEYPNKNVEGAEYQCAVDSFGELSAKSL